MNRKLIGLDIGTSSIKIAAVKEIGQAISLEAIAAVPAPASGIASTSPAALQEVAFAIKQILAQAGINTHDTALCLPESQVYTKVIEMPQLSNRELAAALKFEMEQYVPLPMDQVKTDWEILGKNDQEGKKSMNVMLVAAPISLLAKYQKIMEGAGITAVTIETEIISVYRALLPLLSSPYSNMIVHMGTSGTTVALVRQGVLNMVFSINLGGAALTRSISLDLGIDMGAAESYKNAYGLNEQAFEGKISRVLTPQMAQVVAEIKKGLLAFREKNAGENIKQVILSGGSALLPGIDVYLTNALSTQVVIGSAFNAHNIQNVPPQIASLAPAYNVVVGLALRSII